MSAHPDLKKCVNKATPTPGMRRYPSDVLDQSQGQLLLLIEKKPQIVIGQI